jgi:tripartite-type tricarboxylate transporter receptor subunit TctC
MKNSNIRLKSSKINSVSLLALLGLLIFLHMTKISYGEEPSKSVKFPSKPIRIIVPAAPGGSLSREIISITPYLEKYLDGKVIIDYGATVQTMAYNKFYQAKPDGYTLAYFSTTSAIQLELISENVKFSVKDFSSIAACNIKAFVLLAHPDNWKTFSELLNESKKRPLSMAYTGGAPQMQYRLMEMFLGTKFNYIPYGAAGEGSAAVAGKHVDTLITFTVSALPMVKAGKLKALAVFSLKSDPFLPGVPTLKELGHGEVPLVVAYGMFAAPPNTPKKIITILEKAVSNAILNPEFNKLSVNMGNTLAFKSSSELKQILLNDYEVLIKYKLVAK